MWYENINVLSFIGVVILVAIIACFFLFKGKKEEAKKIILALVVEAELKFEAGTGSMKYAYVLGFVYPKLPAIVRLFISEDALDTMIEAAVDLLKKELAPVADPVPDKVKVQGEGAPKVISPTNDMK